MKSPTTESNSAISTTEKSFDITEFSVQLGKRVNEIVNNKIYYSSNLIREDYNFEPLGTERNGITQLELLITITRAWSNKRFIEISANQDNYGHDFYQAFANWHIKPYARNKSATRKRMLYDVIPAPDKEDFITFKELRNLVSNAPSSKDLSIDYSHLESLVEELCAAIEVDVGNCGEKSELGYVLLSGYPKQDFAQLGLPELPEDCAINVTRVCLPAKHGDHTFLILNLAEDYKLHDPTTWGERAVIVDPWCNEVYKVRDALNGFINPIYWERIINHIEYLQILNATMPLGATQHQQDKYPYAAKLASELWFNPDHESKAAENMPSLFQYIANDIYDGSTQLDQETETVNTCILPAAQQGYHRAIRLLAGLIINQLQTEAEDYALEQAQTLTPSTEQLAQQFSENTQSESVFSMAELTRLVNDASDNEKIIALATLTSSLTSIPEWKQYHAIFQQAIPATLFKMVKYNEVIALRKILQQFTTAEPSVPIRSCLLTSIHDDTLLVYALKQQSAEMIDMLLTALTATEMAYMLNNESLLEVVARHGYDTYLEKLLASEAYTWSNSDKLFALSAAIASKQFTCINTLLTHEAIDFKQLAWIEKIALFQQGISYSQFTVIEKIWETLSVEEQTELLHAEVTVQYSTADSEAELDVNLFEWAVLKANVLTIKLGWDRYSARKPEAQPATLLQLASMSGDLLTVKEILVRENNINSVSEVSGDTALHLAARNGHTHIVRYLLEQGAQATIINADTELYAFQEAVYSGNAETTELLIPDESNEFGIKLSNSDKQVLLADAINHNAIGVTQLLLKHYASELANVRVNDETALQDAVRNNHYVLASCLLKHGADPNQVIGNNTQNAPLLLTIHNENFPMLNLLLEYCTTEHLTIAIEQLSAMQNDAEKLLQTTSVKDTAKLNKLKLRVLKYKQGQKTVASALEKQQQQQKQQQWSALFDPQLTPLDMLTKFQNEYFDLRDPVATQFSMIWEKKLLKLSTELLSKFTCADIQLQLLCLDSDIKDDAVKNVLKDMMQAVILFEELSVQPTEVKNNSGNNSEAKSCRSNSIDARSTPSSGNQTDMPNSVSTAADFRLFKQTNTYNKSLINAECENQHGMQLN
ncbi:MAG: hypothetical protein Tsb005_19090 [Gammaproteobacteria bacterium]